MSHTSYPVFCLRCGAGHCEHMQGKWGPKGILTPREIDIIRLMMDPAAGDCHKQLAHQLGIKEGTLKVYMCHLYRKLGWIAGSQRKLMLWAIANREKLGIALPAAEQFLAA